MTCLFLLIYFFSFLPFLTSILIISYIYFSFVIKMKKLSPSREYSDIKSLDIEELMEQKSLVKQPRTAYLREYGLFWRWAVLIDLLAFINVMEVKESNQEELAIIVVLPKGEKELPEETVKNFFTSIHELISKLCLVQVKITLHRRSQNTEKQEYLISIKYS